MDFPEDNIRLFIGVDVSSELRGEIKQAEQEKRHLSWLKWTKTENLHMTIYFLGNVRKEILENLISLFRLGYSSCRPFTLSSGKWSWGPRSKDPRMIWIRFPKSESFSELVRLSHDWFSRVQPSPQQRISPIPHITVARFRPEEKSPVELPARQLNRAMVIRSLTLWRSDISESGVVYTPLATFHLGVRH